MTKAEKMKEIIKDEIGPLPKNGCNYFFSDGTWSLYELIDYILDLVPPSHVTLTSFSMSEDSLRHLLFLKEEGKILSLSGLFDPSLRKTKTPLLYFALEVFDRLRLLPNHSKIVVFDNPKKPIMLMSSANLGRNKRMEAGVIDSDKNVCAFFIKQLNDALNKGIEV